MERTFYKYQGIGNDYIYFDCFDEPLENPDALAVRLSDRHFSIGGDGIILIGRSDKADGRMRMFNADGSEGNMCGNGVRCVAKFLYDVKGVRKSEIAVETNSGVKRIRVAGTSEGGERADLFTVDMGKPLFAPEEVPVALSGERVVDHPLEVLGKTYRVTCLSMGNPHCVVFGGDPEALDLPAIGPAFERHEVFPARVNTEFAQIVGKNEIGMRVWERGSGETLACGTGACAVAVAAVECGLAERGKEIALHLRGGTLFITYTGETVLMTGPAVFVFRGVIDI